MRLYTNYLNYLKSTQDVYNQTILSYYNLLFENLEFLNLSNQKCLRELEKLTIQNKTKEKPKDYIEQNIPMYLRRAAINQAIGYVRSYKTAEKNNLKKKNEQIKNPSKAILFHSPIIFYKGMYKELYEDSIIIKLFNGEKWKWFPCKIKGRKINKDAEILSPSIVINKNIAMIHIPIKEEIENVTPMKTRMQEEHIRVCGIAFSNTNSFAICVVLDENKKIIKAKFIKGGNEYRNTTQKILAKIRKHKQNGKNFGERDHKHYWEKLNNIGEYYAHKASKEIVDFCIENNASVISITDMKEDVSKHFGKKVGKYSPIYLRKRITQYLQYKAFKNSILITKVRKNYTGNKCYVCRANIKRSGCKYKCENGHQGDYFFNSAMNIAIMCLKKFGK